MANSEHLALIQQGVALWNEWRGQEFSFGARPRWGKPQQRGPHRGEPQRGEPQLRRLRHRRVAVSQMCGLLFSKRVSIALGAF
jgi:hypothetical protein